MKHLLDAALAKLMPYLRGTIFGLLVGQFIACCWIVHDVGRRLNAIEREQKQHASIIRMCLDSINELANHGGSITVENTVEERPQ